MGKFREFIESVRTSKGGVWHRGDFTVRSGEQGTFGKASKGKRVILNPDLAQKYEFTSSTPPGFSKNQRRKPKRGIGSY